eukprot:14300697-Alexandrium_andersonii.AAC.1
MQIGSLASLASLAAERPKPSHVAVNPSKDWAGGGKGHHGSGGHLVGHVIIVEISLGDDPLFHVLTREVSAHLDDLEGGRRPLPVSLLDEAPQVTVPLEPPTHPTPRLLDPPPEFSNASSTVGGEL